jgi:mRNA interferase YafQ
MKAIHTSAKFRKDFKRAIKRGKNMGKLQSVVNILVTAEKLPPHYKPHKLSGGYADLWECHIEPDWLLIYDVNEDALELLRLGTHSDLFG